MSSAVLACAATVLIAALPAWAYQEDSGSTDPMPPALRTAVDAALLPPEYAVREMPGAPQWEALNAAHGLRAVFSTHAVEVVPLDEADAPAWVTLELMGWGRVGQLQLPQPAQVTIDGARIQYRRGPLTEWYLNGPRGLEQGFLIDSAPAVGDSTAALELKLALGGVLEPRPSGDGDAVLLNDQAGIARLSYAQLAVWDAEGRPVEARLQLSDRAVSILIEARDAAYPLTVDPFIATEQAVLTASDAKANASFGQSVAVWGDTAVVGAHDFSGATPGQAYVFVRSGTGWTTQARLTPSDGAPGDGFGYSIALLEDTAIVGSPYHDGAALDAGAAYVYVRSGAVWTEQARLTASDAEAKEHAGEAVALWGDTALVGAPSEFMSPDTGSAFVFVRSGTSWTEQARLTASDASASDEFGNAVGLSGETAIVGAYSDDDAGYRSGSAYIFVRTGTTWVEQDKLTSSDPAPQEWFGSAVAISGDTAVVGASGDDTVVLNEGSAYVYVRSGSSWSEQQKLVASDAGPQARFGNSVALLGETLIVGAYWDARVAPFGGSAYVFTRSGSTWSEQGKLNASDGGMDDEFASSVALSGNTVIVGAFRADLPPDLENAGSAYVYILDGLDTSAIGWSEQAKLTAASGLPHAQFGWAVALAGDRAVVGAPSDDEAGPDAGAAYLFERSGSSWIMQAKLLEPDGDGPSRFGFDVDIVSAQALIVGAPASGGTGAVYVFLESSPSGPIVHKLTAADGSAGDRFGAAVAVAGSLGLVGAPGDEHESGATAGSVYAIEETGGAWSVTEKLVADDAAAGDGFGIAVDVGGLYAIVGANGDDDQGSSSGSAYTYSYSGSWNPMAKLTAADGTEGDRFGSAVALTSAGAKTTAIVGAPTGAGRGDESGAAYVFVQAGATFVEQAKLMPSDPESFSEFGAAVDVSEDTAIVGEPGDIQPDGLVDAGSAYVFARSGTIWTEEIKLIAPDAAADDVLGRSVALSGDTVIVGAPGDDHLGGEDAGSADVIRFADTPWTDLGLGLAGSSGVPLLIGTGTLLPGTTGSLELSNAALASRGSLFISLGSAPAPFKGGTLVPVPATWAIAATTTWTGTLEIPFHWAEGIPSGTSLYFQFAVNDAGAVQAVALSNALRADVP